jgi:hypothetical protein
MGHDRRAPRRRIAVAICFCYLIKKVWRGWNAPNPIIGDKSNLAAVAEELLLRQAYRHPPAHSRDATSIGGALYSPNLLCTRSDIYIKTWGYAGRW